MAAEAMAATGAGKDGLAGALGGQDIFVHEAATGLFRSGDGLAFGSCGPPGGAGAQ